MIKEYIVRDMEDALAKARGLESFLGGLVEEDTEKGIVPSSRLLLGAWSKAGRLVQDLQALSQEGYGS